MSANLIQAQSTITISDPNFTCGDTVKLTAPDKATGNKFYWETTGAILLKEVNATAGGNSVLTVSGSNMVEAIVTGQGTVTYTCTTCTNPVPSIQIP